MSTLLHNVLASRLAQATIGGEDSGNSARRLNPLESTSSQSLEEWENVDEASIPSDEEMIGVISLPGTVPSTPSASRPSSPGLSSRGKRSGLSQSMTSADLNRKSKTDPLRSLPKDVSQRIFLSLPLSTLLSLSLVNKRYRRSATLNYCWYKQCQLNSVHEEIVATSTDGGGAAKWTRRESKIDWKSQYAKQKRIEAREVQRLESLPGSGTTTPSRTQRLKDQGVKTHKEMREEEWNSQENVGYSKTEMREWYKGQAGTKGGKVKGKTGKGGVKTGSAGDGSLWE
ncbi:hypothetical protein CBS101457_001787 [Exobasidium rhododendri]|nr:hypothetical protein CBS101457_001787 [Exobasidium rhododendri]